MFLYFVQSSKETLFVCTRVYKGLQTKDQDTGPLKKYRIRVGKNLRIKILSSANEYIAK